MRRLVVAAGGAAMAWAVAATMAPGTGVASLSAHLAAPARSGSRPGGGASGIRATAAVTVEELAAQVLATFPHDPGAFTQGLLLHDGWLYESTGRDGGEARLRQVDPSTGIASRDVYLPRAADGSTYWGEGLALVGDRLIQLTYLHGVAFEYDLATFFERRRFSYAGQGWGLCFDGTRLVMSDGSDRLKFRDAATFEVVGEVQVRDRGVPVNRLNELECVDRAVYANLFTTDDIVRIDPSTGAITAWIDASGLLTADEEAQANVLNGIAYDPARDTFLLTGKWWPKLFEVVFLPARSEQPGRLFVPLAARAG